MLNDILMDRNSFDFKDFPTVGKFLNELSDEEVKEILMILNNLKKNTLYNGLVHGLYHSEKVFMFTYLLAKSRHLEEPYRQILFDGALYHDIGRLDDREDSFHGMLSANKIADVVQDNDIYKDKYNLLLLRAIVNAHSRNDKEEYRAYEDEADNLDLLNDEFKLTHELDEKLPLYLEMGRILKDADALDRKRFGDAGFESLNTRYLRCQESLDLVQFSEELNGLYYNLMKIHYPEVDESKIEEAPCVHSVGFDFFKINSVLTHGILSQDEMKKRQLKVPRNFSGGNFDRWISVVDIRLLKLSASASQEFIERGVSFICEKVKMHEPSSAKDREEALVTGMPWNKSNHEDERYVKNRIAPENIIAINIPKNYINRSVLDTARTGNREKDKWRMLYIYNSLDIKMIQQRVEYYKEKTSTPDNSPYYQATLKLIESYGRVLNDRDVYGKEKIACELSPILDEINTMIGKMLYIYYYGKIGSAGKDITVLEIVNYELSNNYSIKYEAVPTADGMTYFLSPSTKSIGAKQI